jgi:hypothetical protein
MFRFRLENVEGAVDPIPKNQTNQTAQSLLCIHTYITYTCTTLATIYDRRLTTVIPVTGFGSDDDGWS